MNIIFIDFLIRASKYGIGTYNYLYHNAIEKQSLACLYYIEILSEDILYTRVINVNQNFCHIKIPMPLELKQIEFISDDKLEFFSKTIFHIIKDYLDFKKENTIIHLNSYMGFYLALLIKKTFKYPLVTVYHFLHSQQSINNEEYRSYSAMNKVTMNLEKEAAKISDGIICMSDSVKELISKEFEICPEVIKKLSCGVNIDKFDLIENDQNYRKSLGYGKEEKVIVFCGRLDAQKGLNFLISAFKKLIDYDRKRRYRLLIIGEGLYDTYFKQCSDIWPMVSFTGYLTSERVIKLLKISDIGVVPSIYEPFGLVILEMMACKIPVIASDLDGPSEIITDGLNGLKIKVTNDQNRLVLDETSLIDNIVKLCNNKKLRDALVENAYSTLIEKFNNVRMLDNTIAYYQKILCNAKKLD